MNIEELMSPAWAELLPKAESFLEAISEHIKSEKKIGIKIFPAKENILRVFKEIPPDKIKVIWLGQDPYASPEGQATGRAFECGKHPSPSWRKIAEIYKKEVPDYDVRVVQGILDKWSDNGVFLINKALTVRERMPNSHTKIWESFTRYILSVLLNDMVNPKAVVLLGQEAQKMVPKTTAPHKVFTYEHPAASAYQGRAWKGDGLFTDVKKFMDFHEKDFNW